MDHKHLYLESCQNPTSLNATMLDEDLDDASTQTIEGDVSGQGVPKTSTPAKKNAAGIDSPRKQGTLDPERRADVTESATRGVGGGAMGGAKAGAKAGAKDGVIGGRCCGEDAPATVSPTANASSPQQMSTVPEPIAEISTNYVDISPTGYLCNPDIRRRSEPVAEMHSQFNFSMVPTTLSSLLDSADDYKKLKKGYMRQCSRSNLRHSQSVSNIASLTNSVSSLLDSAEDYKKLKKGYMRQCTRSNLRHSQSASDIASLTNSVSSQHDQIESNERMIGFILDDAKNSKARLEALEKRQVAGCRHNRQTTLTHFIPYDSEKKQGQSSFILPTTDPKLRAELFLVGFGTGSGTHLSLKVTADTGNPNETGHLPAQCRFEILIHNFDDEEETRKKSKNSEENGGSHIVEFPKVIEKDVVENEALGFKKNGMLKITLIVSWAEVID